MKKHSRKVVSSRCSAAIAGSSTATVSRSASHGRSASIPRCSRHPAPAVATPSSSPARCSAPLWSPRSRCPTKVGHQHRGERSCSEQLEQQVRDRVGALEGVAQVGGAEHRGDDQDPPTTDHPGHRGSGTHARSPTGRRRASPRPARSRPLPCRQHAVDVGTVARSDRRCPPAGPPAPARWRPARRSAPGRRRWRTPPRRRRSATATRSPRSTGSPSTAPERSPRRAPRARRAPRPVAPAPMVVAPGRRQRSTRSRWRRPAAARRRRPGAPRRSCWSRTRPASASSASGAPSKSSGVTASAAEVVVVGVVVGSGRVVVAWPPGTAGRCRGRRGGGRGRRGGRRAGGTGRLEEPMPTTARTHLGRLAAVVPAIAAASAQVVLLGQVPAGLEPDDALDRRPAPRAAVGPGPAPRRRRCRTPRRRGSRWPSSSPCTAKGADASM